MATRSSKRASTSSTSASQARSPLSPTRLTRLQEKVELQNLNDRLAAYIDRVRQLEAENNRLNLQIHTTTETVTREVSSVKSSYEKELSDTRSLLDETAKEKARIQLDAGRLRAELEELSPRYATLHSKNSFSMYVKCDKLQCVLFLAFDFMAFLLWNSNKLLCALWSHVCAGKEKRKSMVLCVGVYAYDSTIFPQATSNVNDDDITI